MKTCTRCGVSKDESDFYFNGSGKRRQPCKACFSKGATCRECSTKLHPEATTDLCGFCAPEPPEAPPTEEATPPSAAENRARVAAEQAAREPMKGKGRYEG